MPNNKKNTNMISDLENVFIYELQHIPVNGEIVEKYFSEAELNYFLDKSKKLYVSYQAQILYTAISLLEEVIKDIDSKSWKTILLYNDEELEKVKETFVVMTKQYKETLNELNPIRSSNYKGLVRLVI